MSFITNQLQSNLPPTASSPTHNTTTASGPSLFATTLDMAIQAPAVPVVRFARTNTDPNSPDERVAALRAAKRAKPAAEPQAVAQPCASVAMPNAVVAPGSAPIVPPAAGSVDPDGTAPYHNGAAGQPRPGSKLEVAADATASSAKPLAITELPASAGAILGITEQAADGAASSAKPSTITELPASAGAILGITEPAADGAASSARPLAITELPAKAAVILATTGQTAAGSATTAKRDGSAGPVAIVARRLQAFGAVASVTNMTSQASRLTAPAATPAAVPTTPAAEASAPGPIGPAAAPQNDDPGPLGTALLPPELASLVPGDLLGTLVAPVSASLFAGTGRKPLDGPDGTPAAVPPALAGIAATTGLVPVSTLSTTGTTEPAPVGRAAVRLPTEQLGPVLVALSAGHAVGTKTLSVSMTPGELGRVAVSVERTADGTAAITIAATRPETLQLLRNEHAQLTLLLDGAGIAADARSLSFSLLDGGSSSDPGHPRTQTTPASAGPATGTGEDDATATAASPIRWRRSGVDITA